MPLLPDEPVELGFFVEPDALLELDELVEPFDTDGLAEPDDVLELLLS